MGQITDNPAHKPTFGDCYEHVTYVSHHLESNEPVLVVLEVPDNEELDYQTGVVLGEIVLHEVWAGGINFGPVLDNTSARILAYEAVGHLVAKKRIEAEEAKVWRAAA